MKAPRFNTYSSQLFLNLDVYFSSHMIPLNEVSQGRKQYFFALTKPILIYE